MRWSVWVVVEINLEAAFALAVARYRTLIVAGARMVRHFHLHQNVRQHPHPFPRKVHVVAHPHLARQLLKCHAGSIGHRSVLLYRAFAPPR